MSLRKTLRALEDLLDGLSCDHIVFSDKKQFLVRRWHPSYWIGYVRCVWLGDRCGSVYYEE